MPSQRTLDALRALAARPGTEHEGRLAREILERMTGHAATEDEDNFRDYLRREISLEDLLDSLRSTMMTHEEAAFAQGEECICGERYPFCGRCSGARHETIRLEIVNRFPIGSTIEFPHGDTGIVTRHLTPRDGPNYWAFIEIKRPRAMWPTIRSVYRAGQWLASPVTIDASEVVSEGV